MSLIFYWSSGVGLLNSIQECHKKINGGVLGLNLQTRFSKEVKTKKGTYKYWMHK